VFEVKKLVVIGAAVVLLAGVGAGAAKAQTWPAHCTTFACVNSHMNNLHNRLRTATAVNASQGRRLNSQAAVNTNQGRRLNAQAVRLEDLEFAVFFCNAPVVGVSQFEGYAATNDLTANLTALDVDDAADPGAFVQLVDPECVATTAMRGAAKNRIKIG
jgi:hypothetical protein